MKLSFAGIFNVFAVATFSMLISFESASSQPLKIGDIRDGSKTPPLHIINLYDSDSLQILRNDNTLLPFSTRFSCGVCHSYDIVRKGLHFNAHDRSIAPGRAGEPDIYVDWQNYTLLPLSYRNWTGAFNPRGVALTTMDYLNLFGTHMAGGGIGEIDSLQSPEDYSRWEISGKLEINCLACHDADPQYDPAEYSSQVQKQNYRWAPSGASAIAGVKGYAKKMPDNFDKYNPLTYADIDRRSFSPPLATYDLSKFDSNNKVFFNIPRKVQPELCYFCHSSVYADESYLNQWTEDEDIHVAKGLTCTDCHSNGLDHNMIRGYRSEHAGKDESMLGSSTCEGCHMVGKSNAAKFGRLGAPVPSHKGIPSIHFVKLECTVCHSGKEPKERANLIKTSRAHRLGLHKTNTEPELFPHIQSPVYVRNKDGMIEPHNLIWPSYWGRKRGGEVFPLGTHEVENILAAHVTPDTLRGYRKWHQLDDSTIAAVLRSFTTADSSGGEHVFVTGGKIFELDGGRIRVTEYDAMKSYSWAFAHAVRPASRSLGAKGCGDCHSFYSNFFFGDVYIESSAKSERDTLRSMTDFMGLNSMYQKAFSLTFFFRSWLKAIMIASLVIISLVFVLYTSKGILLLTARASSISRKNAGQSDV